jgi:hypothetical protein
MENNNCNNINSYPKFPDGRTFCSNTMINSQATVGYHVTCKCENSPNGCSGDMYVFTDALEATRDFFCGKSCKATNMSVNATKI